MDTVLTFLYILVLSLWTGGMTIFTFIVTPAIFRSFGRDRAGEIVGVLFPGYFVYLLTLSGLALLVFFLLGDGRETTAWRTSFVLLSVALLANTYVTFKLHPAAVEIKQKITSFERDAPDTPERRAFRRLHALSAVLNLLVLAIGAVLLFLSRRLVMG
jgi:uncharacterized membrane protein